jgi:hydroxymethyl cephem carbamoyltransferase
MLVIAFKPGHDGAVAAVGDGRLVMSLESEKDSFARFSTLTPVTLLELADHLGELPDVVAIGGWNSKVDAGRSALHVRGTFGAGYFGTDAVVTKDSSFFGKPVRYFSSSHERSHIYGAIGMAPRGEHPLQAVLVWEGITGSFYLVDDRHRVVRTVPVLAQPGARFAALFAICDPTFTGGFVRLNDSGKLMALAAFGDPRSDDPEVAQVVERLLKLDNLFPVPKAEFQDSPLYDCGVESELAKTAAAVLTERLFRVFADAAVKHLPEGIPLRISGGCGLNCDWNAAWRALGHFSEVFVPPCTNDSGSALGTAIDAYTAVTGDPYIDWDVYGGLEFERDTAPDPARWRHRPLDEDALAAEIARGTVAAWVQGRWEIGPRALGNRSLLAEPFRRETLDLLNDIKQREPYRPIAPCARVEDLGRAFEEDFEDPHMLYFRRVRDRRLEAVTHVDGSARVQTVSAEGNPAQHALLSAFARRTGTGVLCNTSLNFNGHGFINRMSHLVEYCESRGITHMVVGRDWYAAE